MASADSEVKTLLNFVNLASSDIKAALDKSAPCRRSVDHRKYLQKQLKRFSQKYARLPRGGHPPPPPPPPPARERRPPEERTRGPEAPAGHGKAAEPAGERGSEAAARPDQVPMRKRQLPASFWEEPRPPPPPPPPAAAAAGPLGLAAATASPSKDSPLYEGKKRKKAPDGGPAAAPDSPDPEAAQVRSAWSCCPFQYHRPQHPYPPGLVAALSPAAPAPAPGLGLWRKCSAEGEPLGKPGGGGGGGAGLKLHRPVVWKPIPTKPPAPPPIFSVFGYI